MKICVRPNVNARLGAWPNHPLWQAADEIGVYGYAVIGTEPPNTYENLNQAGFWTRPVIIETGALDEHVRDPWEEIQKVRLMRARLGDRIQALEIDETCYKLGRLGMSPVEAANKVKRFYWGMNQLGIDVHPAEPYPALSKDQILAYLTELSLDDDVKFSRFVLDIDWNAIDRAEPRPNWWQRLLGIRRDKQSNQYVADMWDDLQQIQRWCKNNGRQFGVIVGSPKINGLDFFASARRQWLRINIGLKPDVVVVQSWEPDGESPSLDTLLKIVALIQGES